MTTLTSTPLAPAQAATPAQAQAAQSAQAGLTQMQTAIFISHGVDAYRLPFVYALGADETRASIQRRLRAAVAAAPGLACRYHHDRARGGFVQQHAPSLVESLTVHDRGEWSGTIEQACAATDFSPDIRQGLPLAASLLTIDGVQHLVVEFHHIAIDGPGAALFETLFLAETPPTPLDGTAVMAAYGLVAAAESSRRHSRLPAGLQSGSSTLASCQTPSVRLGRLALELPTATVRRFARAQRSFPRIALQAAFESWLAERQSGLGYAWVSSWRWTLGLADIVGNFPVLLARPAPQPVTLGQRVSDLMEHTADPMIGPDAEIVDAAGVVFSYEDFRQGRGRYVPVDTFPRFALYLRIVVGPDTTELNVEFDRRAVPAAVALDALTHLRDHCCRVDEPLPPPFLKTIDTALEPPAEGAPVAPVTEEKR